MAEYIDKEAFIKETLEAIDIFSKPPMDETSRGLVGALRAVINTLKEMPAADVVEVVRCKDCVHCAVREYDIIDELECEFFDVFTDPLDYCSRGERKGDNEK